MPFTSTFPQVDVPKCNVLKYLFPANEVPSDSPLYIDSNNPHHSLSPRQLLKWIKRLALGLENLGVERGHRVMIFTPNHIFVPVVYLGSVGSGRVFTGANPAYTATGLQLLSFVGIQQSRIRITNGAYPELAHQIKDTQASILFVYPENLPTARTAAKEAGLPTSRIFLFSDVVCAEIDGITDWRSILGGDDESARYSFDPIAGDEAIKTVATLNYSSGTTGLPKGVCISHHNLCANVAQSITVKYLYEKKSPLERGICFLPLYHAYGQLSVCLLAPKLQLPVYILKAFNFTEVLRVVQTYKITHLQVAPPVMVLLAKRPEIAQYDLSSLSHIVSGAAPLSRDLQNQVSEKFNVPVDQAWGMTELTCAGSGAPLGQRDNTGSIGMLLPNCEGKLVDDHGNEVKEGEAGEFYIRGPNVCLGYWRNSAATRDALSPDGWLKTGDVAVMKDNKFWIVDRKKELIKVKGFQVAPAELEAVLLNNNDIDDAAVVGVTLHGEECPRAYISLKEDSKGHTSVHEIQAWMERQVAKHKQLSGGISFVSSVPKSPSGKILRKTLREWAKRDVPELETRMRPRL